MDMTALLWNTQWRDQALERAKRGVRHLLRCAWPGDFVCSSYLLLVAVAGDPLRAELPGGDRACCDYFLMYVNGSERKQQTVCR